MEMNQWIILRTLCVMASITCWISLGVLLACQHIHVGAIALQVCGTLG
jgi:hypothetical protein